jgi:hypothetical protein
MVLEKERARELLEEMRERAVGTDVRVLSSGAEAQLIAEPLGRQNNPPRLVDSTLWGWTLHGRVIGLCKIARMDRLLPHERPWIYCFASLSTERVEAGWADGHHFLARTPGIELRPVAHRGPAGDTAARRLEQINAIARRFTAVMYDTLLRYGQNLRLLEPPIVRYEKPNGSLLDGAVLALVTNDNSPTVILVIELHQKENGGTEWQYGVAAMTAAGLSVRLDDDEIWAKPFGHQNGNYDNWTWFWEDKE